MWLDGFGPRAENPRVGGSILPLATIDQWVHSEDRGHFYRSNGM
jgi:hypothetical protein